MPKLVLIIVICFLLASCGAKTAYVNKAAPFGKRGQKPYTVNGEQYEPISSHDGFEENGIASWYGSDFHGKATSSGETYDMYAMTAAHKTLPLGVYVKVRNRNNGRETVVKINDRGPFVRGRIIDLSYTAARTLGIVEGGTAPVRVEALGFMEADSGRIEYKAPASYDRGSFGIQVGAFAVKENAQRLVGELKLRYDFAAVREAAIGGSPLYRVRVGKYQSLTEAVHALEKSDDRRLTGGFVVALD